VKSRNIFLRLLVLIISLSFVLSVKADIPNSGSYYGVETDYVQKIYGNMTDRNGEAVTNINAFVKRLRKNTENIGYLYSIEPNKNLPDNNSNLNRSEVDDSGYLYLIKNGYPNKNPYDGSERDNYYVTQLAAWMYSYVIYGKADGTKVANTLIDRDGNLLTNYTQSIESRALVETAYELYKGAKNAHDNPSEMPTSIKIKANATNNDLIRDGQYLLTPEISVNLVGATTYKVTATEGMVVDINNNQKNTFNADEKFKVVITGVKDTDLRVIVTASNTVEKVYSYKASDTTSTLLYGEIGTTPITENYEIGFVYRSNRVDISLQDGTNAKEIAGATLVLKDTNGNTITLPKDNRNKTNPWVTTQTPYSLVLEPGTYVLHEEIAPKGYALQTNPVTFTVAADGMVSAPVVMQNKPLSGVTISCRDAVGESELPGASLEIRNSNNKVIDSWVSDTIPHVVTLEPGTYTLHETVAPEGFDLVEEAITFTVLADGSVKEPVILKNIPTPIPVPITASTRSVIVGIASLILIITGAFTLVTTIRKTRKQTF